MAFLDNPLIVLLPAQILDFRPKAFFLKQYENGNKKKFHIMSQGPPNLGFTQEKVQKGDFQKSHHKN